MSWTKHKECTLKLWSGLWSFQILCSHYEAWLLPFQVFGSGSGAMLFVYKLWALNHAATLFFSSKIWIEFQEFSGMKRVICFGYVLWFLKRISSFWQTQGCGTFCNCFKLFFHSTLKIAPLGCLEIIWKLSSFIEKYLKFYKF